MWKGMEISMDLKTHIIDTVKEWQMKIGYREGEMKLYYPGESILTLLDQKETKATQLVGSVQRYLRENAPWLGQVRISGSFERYCLTIPEEGCRYVAEKIPTPQFLAAFLKVITTPGNSMADVEKCFEEYAAACNTVAVKELFEEHEEGASYAFFVKDPSVEPYVYCVEDDEFGLTYHRFIREDYKKLLV